MKTKNAGVRVTTGFTLVELLVVIAIIALGIGIVVPALGGARDLARKTATTQTLGEINTASAQYVNDKRSDPGYFTPREMGALENGTRGFAAAQNIMLSLLDPKGVAVFTQNGANRIAVGPIAGKEVFVDLTLLGGASSGAYFSTNSKNYVAQDGSPGAGLQVTSVAAHTQLKTLVDGWGNPVLAWSRDYQTTKTVVNLIDYASIAFDAAIPSKFYANANVAFSQSTQLGKKGADQTDAYKGSILAAAVPADIQNTICGITGSPSSVLSADLSKAYNLMLPQDSRGSLILQSAGSNGVFVSRKERGVRNAGNILYFGLNYKNVAGQLNQASNGGNLIDVRDGLDDIFQLSGG
ncbi:MAG: prepilin-type N-terminal cleavage/methylation domain-containing protein [Planctomycetota bacterium]